MKKLLALVLALVMTLGLATVGANAAYGDQDEVSFKEAVGVMSALGVFKGNENGDFLPKANLDRASAAKLIAYLDLGAERAEAMPAEQKFNDVPATHWAAKYIAYCAKEGYIAGAGDGNFYPASELTGYAFGKMLLCVLGYNAKAEGYEGTDWTIAVAKQMGKLKLANGVSSPASAVLTREEAAQYCLNALQLETVEYPNGGLTVSSGDVTIEISGGSAYGTGDTLADELYGEDALERDPYSEDAFGRPATEWTLDEETIGLFAQEPALTYTSAVTGKKIYTDLNKKVTDDDACVVVDGDWAGHDHIVVGSASTETVGGNGALTEVYKVDGELEIIVINTYIAKITNWVAATADAKEYITVDGMNFETDEFSSADKNKTWVLYTVADGEIQTVVVPEKVEGVKVTKYNTGVNVTAGGKLYKLAAQSLEAATEFSFTTVYNLYLDTYGNLMMAVAQTEEEVIPSDFLYVEQVQAKAAVSGDLGGGASDRWARAVVIFVDGTRQTVDLKITKSGAAYNFNLPKANGTIEVKDIAEANVALTNVANWFAYTVKDGVYNLTAVDATYGFIVNSNITLTKNQVYRNGEYYTNSATKVVTIGDAAHNYAVVTKTGLVDATLNAKVLVTYAKDKKNIAALYAMTNPEAVVEETTYAYAVEAGATVADGVEWVFAIEGAQVTKVVDCEIEAGKVYDLTEEDGIVTAAAELAFDETDVVIDALDTTFALAGEDTYYFATGYQVYNVDADTASEIGETATLAVGDTVNLFLDGGKIVAAYIIDRAD